MAAVAFAPAGLNGRPDDSRPATPLSAISSTKRKRDDSEDANGDVAADADAITNEEPPESKPPTINGTYSQRDVQAQIRDLFDVLQRWAIPYSH